MEKILRKFIFIFIATTVLFSNFTAAKSRWTRDVQPPNLGPVSTFHRPWYGGRREAQLPEKVFENVFQ